MIKYNNQYIGNKINYYRLTRYNNNFLGGALHDRSANNTTDSQHNLSSDSITIDSSSLNNLSSDSIIPDSSSHNNLSSDSITIDSSSQNNLSSNIIIPDSSSLHNLSSDSITTNYSSQNNLSSDSIATDSSQNNLSSDDISTNFDITKRSDAFGEDMCNIEYIGKYPADDIPIISCSIFKLGSMYRDISVYLEGLQRAIDLIKTKNIFMRVYFDHSIEKDIKFQNLMKKALSGKNIQFCRFYCPSFIENGGILHRGIFGMFVRFLPYFDPTLKNNVRFVVDIDLNDRELNYYCEYVLNKFIEGSSKCIVIQKIGYEWKYANYFKNDVLDGTALSNVYLKNIVIPYQLFRDALYDLRDDKASILKMVNDMVRDRHDLGSDDDKFGTKINTFIYGIDEWFINTVFLPYIFKNVESIDAIYISDNIPKYIQYMIDWNKSNNKSIASFLRSILDEHYINAPNNKNIQTLKNLLSIYRIKNPSDYDNYRKIIKNFYDKVIEYREKIVITDNNWVSNLKKHTDNAFFMFILYDSSKTSDELYNYVVRQVSPVKIYTNNK